MGISVGAVFHGIIGEVGELVGSLIECNRQLSRGGDVAEKYLSQCSSALRAWIPYVQESIRLAFGIYGASCGTYDYHGFACSHDLFDKYALAFGETEIFLVARGELIACVALFALDSCVKTHAKYHCIGIFCGDDSLRISVACLGKTRHSVFINVAALGIEDSARKSVLYALKECDISVGSTVVVALQSGGARAVGTYNGDSFYPAFIKGKYAVIFQQNH